MFDSTKDLTNKQFHNWKVILFSGYEQKNGKGNRRAKWWAECMLCGQREDLYADQLLLGTNPRCAYCNRNANYSQLLSVYKLQAKKRDYEFTLTSDEAVTLFRGNCYYCGIEPKQVIPFRLKRTCIYNGIDRMDNNKGYTKDNCVSCCGRCNWMKGALDVKVFEEHILAISKNLLRR